MLQFSSIRVAAITLAVMAVAAGCSSLSASSPGIPSAQANRVVVSRASSNGDLQRVTQAIEDAIAAMPKPTPPGIAIAVYYKGNPYYYYTGVRRLNGPPVDGNTIFELGSLTKSFTAIMLGAAVNQKIAGVTLDDHPAPWVAFDGSPNAVAPQPVETSCAMPTATPVPSDDYGTVKEMTLEELGTHTSGLPYTPPPPNGNIVQRQCYSPQQLVNYIESGTFPKPPAPWVYSNIGFGFLGYVLQGIQQKHTGKAVSWYQLAREQIIDPLGMTHTYDLNVPKWMNAEYAQPYTFDRAGSAVPALHWTWDPYPAAGVLRSTATDMMKYLQLALRLQGPKQMIAGVVTAQKPYAKNNTGADQGLAWEYVTLYKPSAASPPPPSVIWKDGGTAGCSTWIGVLLDTGKGRRPMGIVVLTNGAGIQTGPLGRAILKPLYLHSSG
jgi:serine-type D-Ala-D-Ala carboxypeptidase/endopeptidase